MAYTIKLRDIVKRAAVLQSAEKSRQKLASADKMSAAHCGVQVSVSPTLIPNSHVLASVNYAFNAVFVRGDVVGDTLFYGRGAGKDATASAVLSDLADAALDLKFGTKHRLPPFVPHDREGAVAPMAETESRDFGRLTVTDTSGT